MSENPVIKAQNNRGYWLPVTVVVISRPLLQVVPGCTVVDFDNSEQNVPGTGTCTKVQVQNKGIKGRCFTLLVPVVPGIVVEKKLHQVENVTTRYQYR
jgi:hypothetical protein